MSEHDETTVGQGCCGCLMLMAFGPTFLLLVVYLFSNGSIGAIKDVEVQELSYFTAEFLPPQTKRDTSFYGALKKNPKVTDLEIEALSLKSFMGEQIGMGRVMGNILGTMTREVREMDGYLDVVRVSFVFESQKMVTIDFLVLEGMFWGTLKSWVSDNDDSWMVIRPWAQYLEIADFKQRPLNK